MISKSNDLQKKNILHIFPQDVALPDQTLAYHDTLDSPHHPNNQKHKFHNDQLEIKD